MNDAGNWYGYHWTLADQQATIRVDLSYAESFDALGDFTTLFHVSCRPLDEDAERFSGREQFRLPGALSSCQKVLGEKAVYVGSVELPAEQIFYFYASDPRLLVPLLNACEKNRALRMECGKAAEPGRETYYQLLYPDAAKRQSADNALYIQSLQARGDNGAALRRVNLHMCFPSAFDRTQFASDAKAMGFAIGHDDYVPEQELPYTLALHVISPLTESAVTELTTKAIYAAEAYSGGLSHLDSAFVPKRSWL